MTSVAVVTGAASGLGRLAALRLAASGARVAAIDRDGAGLAGTAFRSPNMQPYVCDVTDEDAVNHAISDISADLGPAELVLHAAGICDVGAALEQPMEAVRRVLDVNVLGTMHLARATVPVMVERGRGTFVAFGSLAGWVPTPRLAAYSASKFAVTAFCEVLAQETAETGVRVVCVCPDQVETPLTERVRAIDPELVGDRIGADPAVILDAVERTLGTGEPPLFLFPLRAHKRVWRLRRLAPGALSRLIATHVRAARAR